MINYKEEKLNSLMQEELAEVIRQELEFGQGILVSVSEVICSADLGTAKVWLNVWPEEKMGEVLKVLKKNQGLVRTELAERIKMRRVPRLRFVMDKDEIADERQRNKVEEILARLKEEEKNK